MVVKDPVKHKLMVHMMLMASLVYNHFCVTRHVAFVLLPGCLTSKDYSARLAVYKPGGRLTVFGNLHTGSLYRMLRLQVCV